MANEMNVKKSMMEPCENDIKYTVIINCVEADLLSVERGDFTEIIMKMKSLSPKHLESVLEVLNLHVVGSINGKKKVSKHSAANNFQLIPKESV